MPRFIAFHPALFLIIPENGFPAREVIPSDEIQPCCSLCQLRAAFSLAPFIHPISMRVSLWPAAVSHDCTSSVEFVDPTYSANPLLSIPSA
jgi:hypothetical protein